MKRPTEHWDNLVKKVMEANPNATQEQIDSMKLPFMICYQMLAFEFAIDDPSKISEFASKLKQLFEEKR